MLSRPPEASPKGDRNDEDEARFRLVADNIPNLAWMAEPDGAIYWYNQRWHAYTGTTPEQMAGWGWQAVHDPAMVDGVTARFKKAIESGEPWEDIFPLRSGAGEWRWFLSRAMPVRDEAGRIVRWFGTNTDITEQRAAQAALAESNARFQLMADTAPSPVWMTNAEAEVEFVNAALVEYYGRPADQMLGHLWKQAIHPEDQSGVESAMAAARPQRLPYGFDARFQHAGGSWRWMRISVNPRFNSDGVFLGYVGMAFDISETREALDALEKQERRQSFLLALTDRLRELTSSDAVILEVERALGLELGADRVGYGEVDQERGLVSMTRDWTAGVVSAQGEFSLEELGADLITDLAEGRLIQIADVQQDPRTRDALEVFERLETRALMRAPVIRSGSLRAFLYAHSSGVREWTATETALLQEVADRTWTEIERTRAEAEVRESEQRFRAIADTAPVLIWVTQQDRTRAFVNQAYVAYNGGAYEEARLADWRTVIHPDDHERVLQESLAGEASARPFSMEARYLRHDGEYRWLKSFSRPRMGGDNEVIGFVGVAFDVTDIRETAADLVAAAAERDAILGQLAEGVIVTDPDGRITFVNDAAVRLHGVERLDVGPDDYSGTYHLFTEDGRPYPPHELPLARAVMNGETVLNARWRICRPDGSEVLAVGNARPVFNPDGSRIGAVLTLRDDTARVEAENRLAESETRFRTIANSAPVQIWMTDPEGDLAFANRSYKTFFDVGDDDLASSWRNTVATLDRGGDHQTFVQTVEARDRYQHTMLVQHPRLGTRWLRCEGIPRFDAAGVFQGYVGANSDVTEAKRAEEDLKRINELLEERVGEALAEKAKAEADLMHAQRMEAVGRLTGGVAHDFNNLLTVVIGALDIMLRSPNDAAKRQKLGEAALAAARRGEGLTHQLLAFSRRQALRPEALDLNVQIRESEPLLRRAVGEAVEFKLKLRRGGARVSVDPSQFEAALLNLVVNARDAVGDKGRITVQTLACTVDAGQVTDLAAGEYVCVTVSDNGVGMAPEVVARVFEPFFTTKAVGKGTGLGLSQVYGFARQSGGAAQISSTVGLGTEIKLFLPPQDEAAGVAADAGSEAAPPMAAGRRLLLVEDDVSVTVVALELLEGLGLEVRAVETAPQALDLLKREKFDMMLSDVVMPGGMTGIELARKCGRDYPDMRVVLTSGYAGEDVDAALADAPWPFLRKPYSGEQLARVLGELN
ncbi:PAS domain S-box protein [Brevundimonas sp.]|uniref:PAS domain S-box protein n=1 Tax=Brevundimonas sp. TaxID=1871086 RepID=UPI0027321F38|nr:PAS domain S-box protein [Brevundimonas sp.]MDP1914137.1 PAS domain S-box protein [Brevundimonas sp.]